MDEKARVREQLIRTCKITNAKWGTIYERSGLSWDSRVRYRLSKAQQNSLEEYISQPGVSRWLAGSLSSARTRYRAAGTHQGSLGCSKIYVFPSPRSHAVVLIGANRLKRSGREIFRVLALGLPEVGLGNLAQEANSLYEPLDFGPDVSYNLQESLDGLLKAVAEYLPGQGAYLAVRRGDVFRIEAIWNHPSETRGLQVTIQENALLQQFTSQGEARVINRVRQLGDLAPNGNSKTPIRTWMGVPLVLGNRVIALLAFYSSQSGAFQRNDLERAVHFSRQITPFVENAIALAEAGRHLQRLALLNELASAASAGLEIDKVANRVLRMLRRTFETERISLLLLSRDGRYLREYLENGKYPAQEGIPLEGTLAGYVVETGMPLRIDDMQTAPEELPSGMGTRSELAVPLKYRGNVNGVLNLGSQEPNAFTSEDEQLLVVIASHLAGLLENIRLSEESRVRARNLGLIHQVVQRVVGLTEVKQIAQISAEVMAERFSYELATILLVDGNKKFLVNQGVGGAVSHLISQGTKIPLDRGITSKVIRTGGSYLSNNVSPDEEDPQIQGWQPGSRMCVPLREGDQVIGLINVENSQNNVFSENDLLALESLAGFLSSVMMNADRYQQLQTTVRHLQASRETSLDLGADLDMDTLLRRVVNRTREMVRVKGAEIGLLDEDAQVVRVIVSENPWNDYSGRVFPLMTGVAGRVAATGEPLVVNDYNAWSGKMLPDRQAPFNSVAGVPLKFQGQIIGTLTVYDDEPDRVLREEDVAMLELIAPQVAVYIRHARLYQEVQERIKAQQLAERRLIQSARLAAVGEMAAGIAHELNNPLTTVAGFAELILDELPGDFDQRPDLELILRESNRARGVVRRLLDFSRQSESIKEWANLNDIIADVIALVHHLARTSGVEIHSALREEIPLVHVDSNQMKQVLLNFVHNALQAMPTGGTLTLETSQAKRENKEWVKVLVQDTGEGIPKENLDRIFEPFFTTKPTGSGTGLGLSISYGIIADHGGFIEVESSVGVGTQFKIWLSTEVEAVHV